MGKYRVLAFAVAVLLMGTGLASREWWASPDQHTAPGVHDVHLKVYEEVRPVLLGAIASDRLLCKAARQSN
ncbi:MAG: hypothetical protein ACT4P8_19245 [Betaproteobacteria bacterium]